MLNPSAPPEPQMSMRSQGTGLTTPLDVLAGELTDATEATAVWRALFRYARATTSADSILVALYDPIRRERVCVYFAEGQREDDVTAFPPMPLNEGPQSRAMLSGELVVTDDLGLALKGLPQVHVGDVDDPHLTKSSLAVPMRARGAVIGVVELQSYERSAFSLQDGTAVGLGTAMAALATDGLRLPASARHRAELRAARQTVAQVVAEGVFEPVYQPIADLATEELVGYEALTRFADGTAPEEQFARAEACGLGVELEAATLRAALAGGRGLPGEAWLALNVSPRLILSGQPLRDLVASERRAIVLEITERAAIEDYALFRHALRRLPRRIELAIDDAGAGYASFRHIFELRPGLVKLSREFIRHIDRDPARQALVRGLAEVAIARGSLLVAEGLETEAELAAVRQLGVPLGQGFLLGRPAPAAAWIPAPGSSARSARRRGRQRPTPVASPSTVGPTARAELPGPSAVGHRPPQAAMLLELLATGSSLTEALTAITGWVETQGRGVLSSILLLDAEGRLRHGSASSLPPSFNAALDGIAVGPDAGPCGTAAHLSEQIIVRDIAKDPRWAGFRKLALTHGLRACWSTPIRAADGRVLGTFAMYYRSTKTPTQRQLALIATATHLASLAIERDATERRMADLAHLNQLLLSSAGEGLYAVDLEGRVTLANPAAARMLGWDTSELLGQHMHALTHHTRQDGAVYPLENCPICVASAEATEELFWRRDGKSFPVECTATPLIEHGEVVGSAVTFHDITQRLRLADDLRLARAEVERLLADERTLRIAAQASEQRFRELVEGLDAVVWEADGLSERTTFVSQQSRDLLGYSPEEYLAEPTFWENHIHPDDRERAVAACEAAIRDLGDVSLEYRFEAADGRYLWIADRVRVTTDATGHGRRLAGVMIDISERKRLEEQAKALEEQFLQAQKMESVGRLAGGIAHDFNNLLTAINGYAQMAIEEPDLSGDTRDALQQITAAADRATELTSGLLAFSRRQVMQPVSLHLGDKIDDIGPMLRRLLGEDVQLVTRAARQLGHVLVDPGQLTQVILNLAVNARDAMPRGGTLTIEADNIDLDADYAAGHAEVLPGPYVVLSVTDTGIGMDEATRARLFEPFFTTKGLGKGTGLGLATVYGIVKQSGGHIWAYSEPGHGTVFKAYLPRVEVSGGGSVERPAARPGAGRGTEAVLVVEDDRAVRRFVQVVLESRGYRVTAATDPLDALERVRAGSEPIDLLITDIVMPGMSGVELANRIAEVAPRLKVLVTSGYTENTIAHHGLLDPSVPFLQKPIAPTQLAERVRAALDS